MTPSAVSVDADTALYAVFGNPVGHSLSPVMHNRAFAHLGCNAVYLAFRVTDIAGAVTGVRALNICGASITIPHKVDVMAYLDEIDPAAEAIGAVNTLVYRGQCLQGFNTDWQGAVTALSRATVIAGKRVAVLGAGGAARAAAYGTALSGGSVLIISRNAASGERLAEDLNADFLPLSEFSSASCEILINTTPVGMAPQIDAMPVPAAVLNPEMTVMDIVYHPLQTRLLQTAAALGCKTVSGVEMFVLQGAAQFKLWTGGEAPVAAMREAVLAALDRG